MKGLTIHQPFANFIADGEKRYETRSWSTPYRGPLAIHASRNREETYFSGIALDGPFGAVVAVGRLAACHHVEDIWESLPEAERDVGDFSSGRYAWEIIDVKKLAEPVPLRGYQRLWRLPPATATIPLIGDAMSTLAVKEKDFQAQLIELIGILGGMVYHAHDSRREVSRNGERMLVGDKDARGFPDLTIVTRDRRLIFAELKSTKGRFTEEQRAWLESLPDHQAYLWRPSDWDDAQRIIQEGHGTGAIQVGEVSVEPWHIKLPPEATCIACQRA